MEEDEYRATYKALICLPCVFEKALSNQKAKCDLSGHFYLAGREGYSCQSAEHAKICQHLLENLREKAKFSLKLQETQNPLPHNMEVRVQAGGLQGIIQLLSKLPDTLHSTSIHAVIATGLKQYGAIENLPYGDIIRSIAKFKGRKRKQR